MFVRRIYDYLITLNITNTPILILTIKEYILYCVSHIHS